MKVEEKLRRATKSSEDNRKKIIERKKQQALDHRFKELVKKYDFKLYDKIVKELMKV